MFFCYLKTLLSSAKWSLGLRRSCWEILMNEEVSVRAWFALEVLMKSGWRMIQIANQLLSTLTSWQAFKRGFLAGGYPLRSGSAGPCLDPALVSVQYCQNKFHYSEIKDWETLEQESGNNHKELLNNYQKICKTI